MIPTVLNDTWINDKSVIAWYGLRWKLLRIAMVCISSVYFVSAFVMMLALQESSCEELYMGSCQVQSMLVGVSVFICIMVRCFYRM